LGAVAEAQYACGEPRCNKTATSPHSRK
jgi:hypothetical protein